MDKKELVNKISYLVSKKIMIKPMLLLESLKRKIILK